MNYKIGTKITLTMPCLDVKGCIVKKGLYEVAGIDRDLVLLRNEKGQNWIQRNKIPVDLFI